MITTQCNITPFHFYTFIKQAWDRSALFSFKLLHAHFCTTLCYHLILEVVVFLGLYTERRVWIEMYITMFIAQWTGHAHTTQRRATHPVVVSRARSPECPNNIERSAFKIRTRAPFITAICPFSCSRHVVFSLTLTPLFHALWMSIHHFPIMRPSIRGLSSLASCDVCRVKGTRLWDYLFPSTFTWAAAADVHLIPRRKAELIMRYILIYYTTDYI